MKSNRERLSRHYVELEEDWRGIIPHLPILRFPFPVTLVPPIGGAFLRFVAGANREISVYLDALDRLGSVGQPYWEAYPIEGETARFLLNETDELISTIQAELERIARDKATLN